MMLDECSQQKEKKNSLFPPIIESNAGGGGRQNFGILKTMVSGKMHGAPTVRGRWANFRVTPANKNNCSGSLLLSALEVWVEFLNALQPISLSLIFPLSMIRLLPRPPSVFHSNSVRVSKLQPHTNINEITKGTMNAKFSVVIPGPDRFKSTKQNFWCLRSAPRAADRTDSRGGRVITQQSRNNPCQRKHVFLFASAICIYSYLILFIIGFYCLT